MDCNLEVERDIIKEKLICHGKKVHFFLGGYFSVLIINFKPFLAPEILHYEPITARTDMW